MGSAYWCNLTSMIEPPGCSGDAASCEITLTICGQSWITAQHRRPRHRPQSTYVVQRSRVVVKQRRAVYAELVEDLLGVKQPCKRQQQLTTPVRHVHRHASKVRRTIPETLEFPLDVNGQLLCISEHTKATVSG